jgi:putative ABC transport system permease protein
MYIIALKMLFGDKGKYLGIIVAIALSSVIMIQQPAILVDILSQTYGAISDMNLPNIWVMDPKVQSVDDSEPIQDTQLYRVRGVSGVEWAVPFFKGGQKVRLQNGETTQCLMYGLDEATLIGGPAVMLEGKLADLRIPDAVIVDEAGAKGRLATHAVDGSLVPIKVGDILEIDDKRAQVVGIARATPSFMSQPVIFTTYSRAKNFAFSERKLLSFVLAKAKPGERPEDVSRRITAETGLAAYSSEEFKKKSLQHIINNTNILVNIGFVVVIGFVVGTAVTGQIFYNFIQDNLRYFGVFKAMGATDSTLIRMIILQALLVGFVGFGLGAGLSAVYMAVSTGGMGPQPKMTWELLAASGGAVMLIVTLAAMLSTRKVLKLEPAVVFKA